MGNFRTGTPNVANKSGFQLFYIKIWRLFLAKQKTRVVMSTFRKPYNKWRPTESYKVPVEKKGTVLIHSSLTESGDLNGSYMLPYQNANKKDIKDNKKNYFMKTASK